MTLHRKFDASSVCMKYCLKLLFIYVKERTHYITPVGLQLSLKLRSLPLHTRIKGVDYHKQLESIHFYLCDICMPAMHLYGLSKRHVRPEGIPRNWSCEPHNMDTGIKAQSSARAVSIL